ncbi:germination protein, Ger(x)C family [Thermoactinomyces sp. DSM 45891]|uniref:Ger(x)C family spore germination protein n=1 Tax=Thermoactinomyces sp. DSM 45891 TaxID=1761907 RepID=UPI0009214DAA|nr:Ger(x)C family spore germination protein [Thermoactinomyces sp. DSM 45891]SFX05874.1 germination protein, Ger(x)C family [Thermoactinomyces sp. DSM 45891]
MNSLTIKRALSVCFCILSLFILPGCWDQDLLKTADLVYITAFDQTPEGRLKVTIGIHDIPAGQGDKPICQTYTAEGASTRSLRNALDRQTSGKFRTYKTRVFLFGNKEAEKDMYPLLDSIYRDPKAALDARMAVVEGDAGELVNLKELKGTLIGRFFEELLLGGEKTTVIPRTTVQSVCSAMLDAGHDFGLPYITSKDGAISISGIAMFHNHSYTNTYLSVEEATLFLILKNKLEDKGSLFREVSVEDKKVSLMFDIRDENRKFDVDVTKNGEVKVDLQVKIKIAITELQAELGSDYATMRKLEKALSEDLTQMSKQVISKMQKSGFDGLGIGRQLIAHHFSYWKKVEKDWDDLYKTVQIEPRIEVETIHRGIID